MPDLVIILLLTAYAFAAGGYVFTFKYVQSATKDLWAGIEALRQEVKEVVKNDISHLEDRIKALEDK